MLDQVDGQGSRVLTGEDRRLAKKFKNAARQAFISTQTPTPKRNGKKHQKIMQVEGSMKLKSKKGSSGTSVLSIANYLLLSNVYLGCNSIFNLVMPSDML